MVRAGTFGALVLVGCLSGGFDGRGDQAAVTATWTIEGAPAAANTCAALGAVTARLVVRDGAGRWRDSSLEWSCAAGTLATSRIFDVATLEFTVELVDPLGAVVAWAPWSSRTVLPGGNALGNFDLRVSAPAPDASLEVRWRIDGADADAATCAAAGGVTVRLDWRVGTLDGAPLEWPCADGAGHADAAVRSGIETGFRLRLLDADGFTVALAPTGSWDVRILAPGANDLGRYELNIDATRAPLTVLLSWADRVEPPATYVDCGAAGVARLGYRLEDGAGTVIDEIDMSAAPPACTGLLTWAALPRDSYVLHVVGEDEASASSWSADCGGLELVDAAGDTFECRVPRVR